MTTFTYNQFKNPNNEGIYYANHFHDLNTGIIISTDHHHNHGGTDCHNGHHSVYP